MILGKSKSQTIPHIDLNNFEDLEFESSNYVLTSPRSLEACDILNVKPVELIYTPIASLELMYPQYSTGKINEIYLKNEDQRRNKIVLCRKTWNNILAEDRCTPNKLNSLSIFGNSILSKSSNSIKPLTQSSFQFRNIEQSPSDYVQTNDRIIAAKPNLLTGKLPTQKNSSFNMKGSRSLVAFRKEEEVLQKKLQMEQQRIAKLKERQKKLGDRSLNTNGERVMSHRNRDRQTQSLQRQFEIQARKQALKDDVDRYRQELEEYQITTLELARQRAAEKMVGEQQKLAFERHQRELQQQANLQELQRLETERKRKAEEIAAQKEARARQAAKERERSVLESRNLAHAAEKLREEIRQTYQLDSFDKLAQHAKLRNQLGLGSDNF